MVIRPGLLSSTTVSDRRLHREARVLAFATVDYVQKNPLKKPMVFECHVIARAIALALPRLKLVNGFYLGFKKRKRAGRAFYQFVKCEHSWLVTPTGTIIDPYPVGYLTIDVIMVATRGPLKVYGGNQYLQDEKAKFAISRKEIRRKSLILLGIIKRAQKAKAAKK